MFDEIRRITTRRWSIMEVCGGQTHSVIRNGIDQLLPPEIRLIHGPGCPVCVTPLELIDRGRWRSHAARGHPHVVRRHAARAGLGEPTCWRQGRGRRRAHRLLAARRGEAARENPDRQVVFFAVGFETTAPANAMAVARRPSALGLDQLLDPGVPRPGAAGDRGDSRSSPANQGAGVSSPRATSARSWATRQYEPDRRERYRFRSSSPASSRSTYCRGST